MSDEKDKQSEIYEFLKSYTESKGYPPSVREICEAVSLRSTSTVHGHLKRLEKKGND
ncbi:SOS-response transcriptional repressor LexA [Clostridium beijerinckii]|nr:SOS-response transcriptional repressor LexA [Clostridium beijerinckii]